MNRISVLIPAYRCAEVIGQAIDNVLEQTLLPDEIVVADDGSDDDLAARVERSRPGCAARGVTLTYTRFAENRGRGAARNLALDAARGDLVAWFDADDLWEPGKLATQAADFERLRGAHPAGRLLLTCDYLRRDPVTGGAHHMRPGPMLSIDDIVALHTRRHIQLQTVFGPRETFLRTGFDDALNRAEDFDFALRFTAQGGKFVNPGGGMPDPADAAPDLSELEDPGQDDAGLANAGQANSGPSSESGGTPLVHYFRSSENYGAEGKASNRRVVAKNEAIFRSNHIDPKAFLAHKLGVALANGIRPMQAPRTLPPGPVLDIPADDPFAAARPRLWRSEDGAIRVELARGTRAECIVTGAGGWEIWRSELGEAPAKPVIRDWFLAGGRWFLIRPLSGAWFPTERLRITRADSGLISLAAPGQGKARRAGARGEKDGSGEGRGAKASPPE